MAAGPPGIKDVARLADVSIGTVSNVLNRPHLVAPATRHKVESAIAHLGFVRNESARQLRAGRSRAVSLVVLDAGNPFFTDVARGAEEVAGKAGLALYLCNSAEDAGREDDYLELLSEQRVRGVLITPVDELSERLASLPGQGIPVVLVDRVGPPQSNWCSVSVDDEEGGFLAITHLLEQGHERIAFVGGPPQRTQVAERLAGAQRALSDAGLPAGTLTLLETAKLTVAEGRGAGERLLGLPASRRPTAAFCANDLLALGFLQEMTQHGVAVPTEMAIVGYDDIEFAGAAAVPLTSVRQPRVMLGQRAVELLLEHDSEGSEHVHQHERFTPELVVRASSLTPLRRS